MLKRCHITVRTEHATHHLSGLFRSTVEAVIAVRDRFADVSCSIKVEVAK